MYYSSIGKSHLVDYCGYQFELSENITSESKVILVSYRGTLLLLSYKSDNDLDENIVIDYIPNMVGFSIVKNSPMGSLDIEIQDKNNYTIFINNELLVDIYSVSDVDRLKIIGVSFIGDNELVYSFKGCLFEYNLRNIDNVVCINSQINGLIQAMCLNE